ncbi:MAG: ParA family protein [Acidobacteriota bacterium]
MRVIAIMNQKGGCGKTTTAVNLAAALKTMQQRVLLIDLDPQAHATLGLNGHLETSIEDTVHQALMRRGDLSPIIVEIEPGFDLAPSGDDLLFTEQDLGNGPSGEDRLDTCLRLTPRAYDFVLIDCPPNLGPLTFNGLCACREILIPVEIGFFSLNGVGNLLRALSRYRGAWLRERRIRALATMFDRQTNFAKEVIEEMRSFFGESLYTTVIHRTVKLKEAASFGEPITRYAPRSRGCEDFMALAGEVLRDRKVNGAWPGPGLVLREDQRDRSGHATEPESW